MKVIKITILITALMGSLFAQEKTFHLKSGDQVTGSVKSQTDSTYVVETAFGVFTIPKSDLKPKNVVITLNSGDIIRGEMINRSKDKIVIKSTLGEIAISTENIVAMEDEEVVSQQVVQTQNGPMLQSVSKPVTNEWFFSKERLMDIWFDPTGFTLEKNKFYVSGLSWAFGLNDQVQISTKFLNYFWQDFNVRPKIMLFKKGNIDSQMALSVGGHFHTKGLPAKYKWVEDSQKENIWLEDTQTDSVIIKDGIVRFGAEQDEEGYWDDLDGDGDKIWYEAFGAFTVSKLRSGGNGRINYTLGASAVFYPNEDIAPRIYGALDIDITRSVKVMSEVFYDPYHVHIGEMIEDNKANPIHFDLGFLTNKLPLFGLASQSDNLWVGWHFQAPFISFYWKF